MPINELKSDSFFHFCAACGDERMVLLREATPEDGSAGDHAIRLPACRKCGSIEFLVPRPSETDKHPEPGSHSHLRRLLIEELDERLTPSRADAARAAGRAKWFPTGFKLPDKFKPADVAGTEEPS